MALMLSLFTVFVACISISTTNKKSKTALDFINELERMWIAFSQVLGKCAITKYFEKDPELFDLTPKSWTFYFKLRIEFCRLFSTRL